MNNNEYNKAEEVLRAILASGKVNTNNNQVANESNVINMINSMDKDEMINKLNSMGLGFISNKIKNTSKEDLIKMLKSNPQLLNKINNFIK